MGDTAISRALGILRARKLKKPRRTGGNRRVMCGGSREIASYTGRIFAMTSPRVFYRIKPAGDSIAINRTVKIIGDGDGPFVVLVTERDYLDDPSGETQTLVFRQNCDSIDATAVAEKQVELSLADGFLHNKMGMIRAIYAASAPGRTVNFR
jgi:hypothetical protein